MNPSIMAIFRKILISLLFVLVVIQFIRPSRNISRASQPNYIGNEYSIPGNVKTILAKACNDCHSNNTRYPWYALIQPVYWWLDKHIRNGKKHVNYDEYLNRSLRYQYHKMEETIEMVKDGEMPLNSYTLLHKQARLSESEKAALISWAGSVMDSMKLRYPMDSLVRSK